MKRMKFKFKNGNECSWAEVEYENIESDADTKRKDTSQTKRNS